MKKILTLMVTLITLSGCQKDLLDTAPYSAISSQTMWTTDNLTDLGVSGVYSALRLVPSYKNETYGATGQNISSQSLMTGTITSSDGMFTTFWQNYYEGIQRANDAIINIPLKSPSDAAKKARYMAECKFLRGYDYLCLNRVFKGVPIYLEPFTPEQATKARSTEADVWNQVIADLTDAINEPNLPNFYAAHAANYGHITKGAAYALRGKAYMYLKNWAAAVTDFASVKSCGYSLFSDYKSLFKEANEECPEIIFSLQEIAQTGYGLDIQLEFGNRSSFTSDWDDWIVQPDLVDTYEYVDGTKFNWNNVIPGYSSLTPNQREVYFLRNNLTAAEISAAALRGAQMSLYLPNGNEQRILAAYTNRDPRLAATVITPYSTYLGSYSNTTTPTTSTMRWPYRAQALVDGDLQQSKVNYLYYLYRKFVGEGVTEVIDRSNSPIDYPLIRYADVLLMWAEALNEQGLTSNAIAKVNEVRARAGIALLNSNTPTTVLGQADLRERIRNERRVEFPGEGIDFFDELRWGSWKDKVFYPGNGVKEVWGTVQFPYSFKADYITTWAIPQVEIQRNPNLVQNPGWIQ